MKHSTLSTQDMGLAIALLCKGFELARLAPSGSSGRYTFCFPPAPKLEDTMQDYWSGRLPVDAKSVWSESKNLKTRLYSLK